MARLREHWRDYLVLRAPPWLQIFLFWPVYRLCVPTRQDAPILVYTMGKVGTNSLAHALHVSGCPFTHPVHRLRWSVPQYPHFSPAERHEVRQQRLRCLVGDRWLPRAPRLRVVTAVRDPLGRLISLYLFAYRWLFGTTVDSVPMATLVARFPHLFDREYNHPLIPGEFFATEIFGRLGIDVFAHPFPADRGWSVIEHRHISLLVLKSEIPDPEKIAACQHWLQRPVTATARCNSASQHAYGAIYEEFKRQVRIPRRLAEALYGSRFMHHFYTPAERAALWRRWTPQLDATLTLPAWFEASLARHHPPFPGPAIPPTPAPEPVTVQ